MLILLYNSDEKIKSSEKTKDLERKLLMEGLRELHIEGADHFTASMIRQSGDGKPFLPDYPGFRFNFSHSGSLLACAFSNHEVGLDLQEHVSSRRWENISKRFFTATEYEALRAVSERQTQSDLFFRLWTLKEAYLKYIGCGLRGEMNSFLPVPLPDRFPHRSLTVPEAGCSDPALKANCSQTVTEAGRSDPALKANCSQTVPEAGRSDPALKANCSQTVTEAGRSDPAPEAGCSKTVHPCFLGRIRILKEKDLLTPASCALLPTPAGYSMAVCAKKLPETFSVRHCHAPL